MPLTALPLGADDTLARATTSVSLNEQLLDLTVGNLLSDDTPRLLGLVDEAGHLAIVVWELAPGFPEVHRVSSCADAGEHGAIALGDFDGDGQTDVALIVGYPGYYETVPLSTQVNRGNVYREPAPLAMP